MSILDLYTLDQKSFAFRNIIGQYQDPRDAAFKIISVTDPQFGAKGDGVTDDTAAVIAFLTAISGKSGYMPAGIYNVTSTLSLTKSTLLYGDGANASIISYTGAGVAVQAIGSNDNWKSLVRDLKITTTTGTHGLRIKDLADFTTDGVYITGFSTTGVHLTGTAGTGFCLCIRLFKNWIMANTGKGILCEGVNNINQIAVHGNRIQGNTLAGISIENAGIGWSILGNDIEGNGGAAELYINGGNSSGIDVGGNYLECSNSHPAILVADTQDQFGVDIHGNNIGASTAVTNAINMGVSAFARGCSVHGNTFSGQFTNAINAQAAKNCQFGPNHCTGSIVHITNISNSPTGIVVLNADNRSVVTYSASMTPDCSLGTEFDITATNGTAFTINAPASASDDMIRVFTIRNTSGGALGAVTWDAVFKMSAWTSPATANSRSITFKFNGTNWVQISQTGVDVPN